MNIIHNNEKQSLVSTKPSGYAVTQSQLLETSTMKQTLSTPNALLITAHPNSESFNFALTEQAQQTLQQQGWQVNSSALHQIDFDPRMGDNDYPQLDSDVGTGLAQKQQYALEHDLFCPSIANEQSKLRQADLVILQFPLWWGSFPAILKGWIDRVCSYGFAYGSAKQLSDKHLLLCVTTGGADNETEHQYYLDKINTLGKEIFGYMGMNILPPHLAHGPSSKNQAARVELLSDYEQQLSNIIEQQF